MKLLALLIIATFSSVTATFTCSKAQISSGTKSIALNNRKAGFNKLYQPNAGDNVFFEADHSPTVPKSNSIIRKQNSQEYEHPETKELVALVKEAAKLLQNEGEKAFEEFRVKDSRWRKDETYIFVFDLQGKMLVHPDPKLEGKNQLNLKDTAGKPIIKGLLSAAQAGPSKPEGWYHYQWPVPGSNHPAWKSSYVQLVKAPSGKSYLVSSGMYTNFMERAFVIDAVENAVAELEKHGSAALSLFKDPAGPYRAKDAYLFIINSQGVELVNPAFPEYVGKNVLNLKDANGKLMIKEMLTVAKSKGTGWVDYMWPKPGVKKPTRKSTYVSKAKLGNEMVMVGCGVYF